MKKFTKIFLFLFFIFSVLSAVKVNSQGLSNSENYINNITVDYDVLIYPNPVTNNKFWVKSETVIKSVEVINVLGQNIRTVNNETNIAYNIFVELGNVKEGMYMVKITFSDKKTIIRKIIVKYNFPESPYYHPFIKFI